VHWDVLLKPFIAVPISKSATYQNRFVIARETMTVEQYGDYPEVEALKEKLAVRHLSASCARSTSDEAMNDGCEHRMPRAKHSYLPLSPPLSPIRLRDHTRCGGSVGRRISF
jgi:hypothetical protein